MKTIRIEIKNKTNYYPTNMKRKKTIKIYNVNWTAKANWKFEETFKNKNGWYKHDFNPKTMGSSYIGSSIIV